MGDAFRVQELVRKAVLQGVAPSIAFGVRRGGGQAQCWYAGLGYEGKTGACSETSLFDLASLTKPLSTTAWALALTESGHLDLNAPLGRFVAMASPVISASPVWRLMNHSAGLPAHMRYFEGLGPATMRGMNFSQSKAAVRRMLQRTEAVYEPGHREIYSDLGYLLLELICESLDGPLAERWGSLPGHGADGLHFRPLTQALTDTDQYEPTERCPWRGKLIQGEVHDDNAWTMGGVCGHAGLFGTLPDVLDAGENWMRALRGDADLGAITCRSVQRALSRDKWRHMRGTRVLGWDTPTPGRSSSGQFFGRNAVGHLGFTGTSIWLDPDEELVAVLLTNRVCPTRRNDKIKAFRPLVHDAAWRASSEGFT